MAWRLFILESGTTDRIHEVDPDGANDQYTSSHDLPAELTVPNGAAFFEGRLIILNASPDELWEWNFTTNTASKLRDLPATLTIPTAMVEHGGGLVIADNDDPDELWRVDPDGSATEGTLLRALPTGISSPDGAALLGTRFFIVDRAGNELWELDPDGSDTEGTNIRDFTNALTSPYAATIYDGRLLVAGTVHPRNELWEHNPDGANSEGTNIRDFSGIAANAVLGMAAHNILADAAAPTVALEIPFDVRKPGHH